MKLSRKVSPVIFIVFAICVILTNPTNSSGAAYDPADFTTLIPTQTVSVQSLKGKAVFNCERLTGFPGRPRLPLQSVSFILPEDADLKTVKVVLSNVKDEILSGYWDVDPAGPYLIGDNNEIWPTGIKYAHGKDTSVYSSNAYFPANYYGRVTAGKARKFIVANVEISPYRFNPVTRKLRRITSASLTVSFVKDSTYTPPKYRKTFSSPEIKRLYSLKEHTVNLKKMDKAKFEFYFPTYDATNLQLIIQAPKLPPLFEATLLKRTYVILSTNYIVSQARVSLPGGGITNGSVQLVPFMKSKQARLFDVTLVTEDKRYKVVNGTLTLMANEGWGGGFGQPAAENIRAWLTADVGGKPRWDAMEIEYLLLIGCGDPTQGTLPMKSTYPMFEINPEGASFHNLNLPTDYYYAELTSDWISPVSGRCGVLNISSDYDFDLQPEISVARIPVNLYGCDVMGLDSILLKIMAYTDEKQINAAWRKNVLLPIKPLSYNDNSWEFGERIKDLCTAQGFGYYRIYDTISEYNAYLTTLFNQWENGEITKQQYDALIADYKNFLTTFPEVPWNSNPANWLTVSQHFGIPYDTGLTNAPADDDPYNDDSSVTAFNELIFRQAWANDTYGLVIWKTHGLETKAMYIYDKANDNNPAYPQPDNNHPAIIFMDSCLNSYPYNTYNMISLGSSMLLKGAAVGTVGATQVSLGGENLEIADTWAEYVIKEELSIADARDFTITRLLDLNDDYNFLVFNPYGDPSVGLFSYEPR